MVIGILAAITIVAYQGITSRAQASAAQSATAQASKKLAVFMIDNSTYPVDTTAFNTLLGSASASASTTYQYSVNNSANPPTYCITVTNGSTSYKADSTNPQPTIGGCAGHGTGGVAAITNRHNNPGAITTGGYTTYAGTGGVISSATAAVGWSQSGNAFRETWNTVPTNVNDGDIGVSLAPFITAGVTYTIGYKIGANRAASIGPPALYASSGTYTTIARSVTTIQSVPAGTQQTRWVTFSADAAAITANLRVVQSFYSKVSTDWMEVSDAIIVQGSTVPNYADGSSPGWIWNGTVNASTSTGPPL